MLRVLMGTIKPSISVVKSVRAFRYHPMVKGMEMDKISHIVSAFWIVAEDQNVSRMLAMDISVAERSRCYERYLDVIVGYVNEQRYANQPIPLKLSCLLVRHKLLLENEIPVCPDASESARLKLALEKLETICP